MRLNLLDTMIALAYGLGAGVLGLALMRLASVQPSLALSAGGLFFILCVDMHAAAGARRRTEALAADLGDLRAEMKALKIERADTLARLAQMEADQADLRDEERAAAPDIRALEDMVRRLAEQPELRAAAPAPARPRADLLEAVREALEDNRVDLWLQPIVTLPQRRVRHYESFTRLRLADGAIVMPGEFLEVARQAGLLHAIDNILLFRCVQIVRRLAQKERRVGVFCNVSLDSLADPDFFPQFFDFMRRNADLADSLVFEVGQAAFEARSPEAARSMARLADFGFRFSIDHVTTLDCDMRDMQRAGVKFFKVSGRLLAQRLGAGGGVGGVAAEDFAGHLARSGIELIAEKIEDEPTVVEVLEYDVALGQGHLFGEPRPAREPARDLAREPAAMEPAAAAPAPLRAVG